MQNLVSNTDDYKDFETKGRRLERNVIETTFKEGKLEFSYETEELTKIFRHELGSMVDMKLSGRRGQYDIRCLSIQVDKDDGMTWAAESINEAIEKLHPQYAKEKKLLQGYVHDGLPLISQLLSEKKIRNILKKHLFPTERGFYKIIIPVLVAFLYVTADVLTSLSANPDVNYTKVIAPFFNPNFWIIFGLILSITIAAQHLYYKYILKETEKTDKKIIEQLENENFNNSDKFERIIDTIVQKIRPYGFRIIIVDNFSQLDIISRKVIEQYLLKYNSTWASEFWVVFDNKKTGVNNFNQFIIHHVDEWIFRTRTKTFDLIHVGLEQKRKLIELLQVPKESENYRFIKTICKGELINANWNIEQLVEYRENIPKSDDIYEEFELFFLISLLSSPANMFFSKDYLTDILSSKGKIRSRVVEKFLFNTKLNRLEIKERLDSIFLDLNKLRARNQSNGNLLSKLTETRQTGRFIRYSVIPEIKYSLVNNYRKLDLPNPKLGHLFWSLYWGDNINKLREAAWLKKLCHHLSNKGDISRFSHDEIRLIYERLFDIYLDAIEGCLTTGLYSNVSELLDDLLELSREDILKGGAQIKSLFRKCWQCYIILQDPAIMEVLVEARGIHDDNSIDLEEFRPTEVDLIFWETIPSQYVLESEKNLLTLTKNATHSKIGEEEIYSISIYSQVYSIWIRLMLTFFSSELYMIQDRNKSKLIYFKPYHNHFDQLMQIFNSLLDNLESKKTSIEIDLLSISSTIWNIALTFHFNRTSFYRDRELFQNSKFDVTKEEKEITQDEIEKIKKLEQFPVEEFQNFKRFLKILTKLSTRLNEIVQKSDKTKLDLEDNTYLKKCIIFDIYPTTLMAIVLSYKSCCQYGRQNIKLSHTELDNLNSVIASSNTVISYKVPEINEGADLIHNAQFRSKINSLTRLCIITWRGLDLENLADNLSLRGIYFNIITGQYKETKKVVKASSDLLRRQNIHGVFANLLVVIADNDSIEIKSLYFYSALEIILENDFGKFLTNEFLMLFLAKYPKVGDIAVDLSNNFSNLVESGEFDKLLSLIDESQLDGFIMQYFNMSKLIKNPVLREQIQNKFLSLVEKLESSSYKDNLMSYFASLNLRDAILQNQDIHASAIVNDWAFNKNSHSYASVLDALVIKGHYKEVKKDCLTLLNKNYENSSYSIFLHLANSMSKFLTDGDDEKQLISDYIDKSMVVWSNELRTETNIEIYNSLINLKPEKSDFYKKEIIKWFDYKSHLYDLQMKYLIDNRRYYDFYRFCHKILRNFGLETDIENRELEKTLYSPIKEVTIKIKEWLGQGGAIPNPFILKDNSVVMSSKFLIIGHFIFETAFYKDEKLSEHRHRFNSISEHNKQELFNLIMRLPDIPTKFREIISRYSQRFEEYTTPEELSERK